MRCALVNLKTNMVENIIVADPEKDHAPDGYFIIKLPEIKYTLQYVPEAEEFLMVAPTYHGKMYVPETNSFVDPNEKDRIVEAA